MFLGYIAEYFSYIEPTDDQFRDVCLFSLGLVLTGLLVPFIHAYGFFMGVRASMDARIITTSAIYQKVHVLYCVVSEADNRECMYKLPIYAPSSLYYLYICKKVHAY